MPALKLFGRKWLAGTDDMVFPCLLELIIRIIWLILMAVVTKRYYTYTFTCSVGGEFVRVYLIGMLVLISIAIILLLAIVNRSAQGSIVDVQARKHVPLLLGIKLVCLLPEGIWNILGTIWAFTRVIECPNDDHFTNTVVDVLVIFDWIMSGLAIFALAMVLDPIGSIKLRGSQPDISIDTLKHRKVTRIWVRRFRWFFCWLIRDKQSHEAFSQVAGLFSSIFRDSDLVPSDIIAGFVLLRVKQKRESREQRRIELLAEQRLKYTSDVKEAFANVPNWMDLEKAHHYMLLSMAVYGYPFVMYQHICTGVCKLLTHVTCCACLRQKKTIIKDDNCCLCYFAGVKYISKISEEDIIYANFRNRIFKLPFYILACHKTKSIVLVIRGSLSIRDIFTDLTCVPEKIEAEGLPPDSLAHKGMLICATKLKKHLADTGILEKAFAQYTNYGFIITGHSLGAGVSVLVGILLRPIYPDLKVYAFSTPAGLLTREAARYTESFVMTIGVGEDCVMRLSIESIEETRGQMFNVLQSCRLPKYRVMVNGFGYALFGVPSRDLEATWRNDRISPVHRHHTILLPDFDIILIEQKCDATHCLFSHCFNNTLNRFLVELHSLMIRILIIKHLSAD
uniref:sn-1-specific diacylglycerol lipase n=1 Tax=Clastoptera arizonana TaxID=38151 RepID=A0A1B6E9M6_9HEMI